MDIKDGRCVRLYKGDFSTIHQVADNPLDTAIAFKKAGAEWIHMVDLDGAKTGHRINSSIFLEIAQKSGLKVELGGGIRDMKTLEYYLYNGISRCILGSAALKDPQLVRCAVEAFGDRIAVGIDAVNGMVAAEGWLEISNVPYIQMAQQMEKIGVKTLIFTDISKDGTLEGPNFVQLSALTKAVSCNIIASGGIRDLSHICKLADSDIYGAICGKSLYSRTLHLDSAIVAADLNQLFKDSPLIPAIIQENETGEVLMLAYMNRESIKRTLDSGTTWFWSRSRQEYWNKGATSGHYQHVVSITADCDDDALLIRVKQDGAACHTGSYSCFFKNITPQN
ncbi:MAG TPA: phosphoribosylformimino-5-aminoimidazole carboxamide ribotide isomerase [Ruminococcaceae bacterium]|nr:phosphoribosylformimino-5-aminoimidazole carboxamide ribotide isomerase [Oscillospiraceae bacterium]